MAAHRSGARYREGWVRATRFGWCERDDRPKRDENRVRKPDERTNGTNDLCVCVCTVCSSGPPQKERETRDREGQVYAHRFIPDTAAEIACERERARAIKRERETRTTERERGRACYTRVYKVVSRAWYDDTWCRVG